MDNENKINIPSSPCLTREEMLAYLTGRMDTAQKVLADEHLNQCDFCMEALDGFHVIGHEEHLNQILIDLDQDIDNQSKTTVFSKKSFSNNYLYYSAAAVFILILTSIFFFNPLNKKPNPIGLESSQKEVQDTIVKNNQGLISKNTDGTIQNSPKKPEVTTQINIVEDDAITEMEVNEENNEVLINKEAMPTEYTPAVESPKPGYLQAEEKDIQGNAEIIALESKKSNKRKAPSTSINKAVAAEDLDKNIQLDSEEVKIDYVEYAISFYDQGEYEKSLVYSTHALLDESENIDALCYQGQANFRLKRYAMAIQSFNSLLNLGDNTCYHRAKWLKSQCLLNLGERDQAISLLEEIISENGQYKEEAEKLLNSLK